MHPPIGIRFREKIAVGLRFLGMCYARLTGARFFYPLLYGGLFALTFLWAWCFLHPRLGVHFSQDSFQYYLNGKNLFSGLGYTAYSARDLSVPPVWPVISRSFPPLHPILIGLVDVITGLGMRSASLVSLFYLAGTIIAMFLLARVLDRRSWLIPFFGFVLFFGTNAYYQEEMAAGRSIPGMMLFFILALTFFFRTLSNGNRRLRDEILVGLFLAAMLHQRFDQTLFTLAFIFLCFFVYKLRGFSTRESLLRTGTIAGSLFVLSLPWAVRNIIHFGTPFASDNTGSVTSTFTGLYCNSFWLPGREPPTLFTNPELWLNQRTRYLINNFDKIVTISQPFIYIVPITVLAMWQTFSFNQRLYIVFTIISFATTLFTITLTPYGDHRYFSLVHLNVCVVLGMCISNAFKLNSTKAIRAVIHTVLVLVLTLQTFSDKNRSNITKDLLHGRIIPNDLSALKARYDGLAKTLDQFLKPGDILSVKPHNERYTYFTGRRTVYFPSTVGFNHPTLIKWLEVWGVDYMLLPMRYVNQLHLDKFVVTKAEGSGLVDSRAFLAAQRKKAHPKKAKRFTRRRSPTS